MDANTIYHAAQSRTPLKAVHAQKWKSRLFRATNRGLRSKRDQVVAHESKSYDLWGEMLDSQGKGRREFGEKNPEAKPGWQNSVPHY